MARMIGAKAGAAAIFALLISSSSAFTAPASALVMKTGGITSQPIGHYEFCQTYKNECRAGVRNQAPAKVTEFGWNVVREINAAVNRDIAPMSDKDLYGKEEFWTYSETAGDCEEYVLMKRKKLMEKGFAVGDLLITVVRKPDGEGHAVLTLRTTQGDFILDNLAQDVKTWNETPYRYLKRQATFHAGRWVSIENGETDMVSSVAK